MRLFKANQPARSEEDRAAALRLTNIAARYRPARSLDAIGDSSPQAPEAIQ
jgi:hypothetical protein